MDWTTSCLTIVALAMAISGGDPIPHVQHSQYQAPHDCLGLVSDCGAAGDGIVDDTRSFIRCQQQLQQLGGGCVHIPKGHFRCIGVFLNMSHTRWIVDNGAVFSPPLNYTPDRCGTIFTVGAPADNTDSYTNISFASVWPGSFTVDVSRQLTGEKAGKRQGAFMFRGKLSNFEAHNFVVRLPGANNSGVANALELDVANQSRELSPTQGMITNVTTHGGSWGYGLVQVQSGDHLHFENLDGTGGVTLRLETGIGRGYVGDVTARNIVCRSGFAALMTEPHSQQNGRFDVENVTSFGCSVTVLNSGGYLDSKRHPSEPKGYFSNSSTVTNVRAVFDRTSQPEAGVYDWPSCTALGTENSPLNYEVVVHNVVAEGFPPPSQRTVRAYWERWWPSHCYYNDTSSLAGSMVQPMEEGYSTVYVSPSVKRSIGGVSTLDRTKWFGGHWSFGSPNWRPQDYAEFGSSGYRTHPGRAFVFSGGMSVSKPDPARPGYVDRDDLIKRCKTNPATTSPWSVEEADFIHSSKTGQLYPNSCQGKNGSAPKGFLPGSHNATAEFFALYYTHCMVPTVKSRYLIEVANECNVKVWGTACNTTWDEMIALHVAVADALHSAHNAQPDLPKPLVCGPTAAFPEYEGSNFKDWSTDGIFSEFATQTANHIDCLSIHFYDTFYAEADSEPTDPYSSNFSVHSGSNLFAEMDLQEVATAAVSSDGQTPLPLLVSEYGAGFSGQADPRYTPGHDWWVMRAVTAKLMAFMDRPDRILRALPFITDKATWSAANKANNGSHSYPWVLWRTVVPPGADPSNTSAEIFVETHLHKWFATFSELDGDRVMASSDNANIQVHCFVNGSDTDTSLYLVMNNLDFAQNQTVSLSGVDQGELVTIKHLYWNTSLSIPSLDTFSAPANTQFPKQIELRPGEVVVIHGKFSEGLADNKGQAVVEQTYYPDRMLQPMANSSQVAAPYMFNIKQGNSILTKARIGFGGAAASVGGAQDAFNRTVSAMHISICGTPAEMMPERQVGGKLHINKEFSYFASIEVAVKACTDPKVPVIVWSDGADNTTVAATVVLTTYATVQL